MARPHRYMGVLTQGRTRFGFSHGMQLMVLAAFFFSVMTLFVKLAGRRLPTAEIVFFRGFVALVFSYVTLKWRGVHGYGHDKAGLLWRGLAGFGGLVCLFYAVANLPLADATVIQYTNPVFTAILAAFYLRERFTWASVAGAFVSLAGVVVIARPGFLFGGGHEIDPFYAGVALVGAVLNSVAYVTVRKLSRTESPLVIVFYFPLVATVGALPVALPDALWPTWTEWVMLVLGIGLCAQIAQLCMTKGLQLEPAGRATAMSYLQIVFAAVWGVLFLAEVPDGFTVAGAVLVAAGAFVSTRGRVKAEVAPE